MESPRTARTVLDLLRHGEPEGGPRYRGNGCDDPLSERGWEQAWNAVGHAADAGGWDHVATSPLRRCRAFAEALAARSGNEPVRVIDALQEIGFGHWEGCTREDVRRRFPEEWSAYLTDPAGSRPRGAEPLAAFRRRVVAGRDALLAALAADPAAEVATGDRSSAERRVLVVAHAGTIRALVGDALALPDAALARIACPYAAASRLVHDPERGWSVEFSNRPHFPSACR